MEKIHCQKYPCIHDERVYCHIIKLQIIFRRFLRFEIPPSLFVLWRVASREHITCWPWEDGESEEEEYKVVTGNVKE